VPNREDVRVSIPADGIESRINEMCRQIGGRGAAAAVTVNMAKPPSDFAIIGRVVWFGRQI
jgi:hypothetical protein